MPPISSATRRAGLAAVIDPQRDVDGYLADAERLGLRIEHVVLTHLHADFLAGHLELRDLAGATIHLGARAEAEYDFAPLADGDRIELGAVRLEALETPGHSPESISILVYDLARRTEEHAVLTGDTLFIGDVGRPDLRASLGWSAEELGSLLYDSLHTKLLPLPDETLVYPAHGAGSLCGKHLSTDTVSTIGIQRRYNYALQPMSREEFIEVVTADQPDSPAYFTYDAVLNAKERPTLDRAARRGAEAAADSTRCSSWPQQGAQLLDTRLERRFRRRAPARSVNIGLDGSYATWAGTLLDHERPIVLVVAPGLEQEAALGRIGFDNVAGYLDGGMMALEGHPELVERIERITAATLAEQLEQPTRRSCSTCGPKPSATSSQSRGASRSRSGTCSSGWTSFPADRSIVVHCATGYRSSIAASILRREGFAQVADLVGGLTRPIWLPSARSA